MSEAIDSIRLGYRLAKAAETTRIRIDHGLTSFARVYLTAWNPGADPKERKRHADKAREIVMAMLEGEIVDDKMADAIGPMIGNIAPSRLMLVETEKMHRKEVEKIVACLPAWKRIGQEVSGFSSWGMAVIIGEAGDIGEYSGCRKLYKRLGLAPDECYERGEDKNGRPGGRKIPRSRRGRIMGCVAEPLLRAQWRGEREDAPAHPIGPFGEVYGSVKARALESGKTKGHADKLARRAMVKALLHDIHAAWHEHEFTYVKPEAVAA